MKSFGSLALFVVAGIVAYSSTIGGDGVPSFRHDWSWPATSEAFRYGAGVQTVWNPNGIGSPYVRIVDHPALYLIHALAFALDPKWLLVVVVIACAAGVGYGTYRLLVSFEADVPIALVLGIVAAFGPPAFDKFVAGHYYYLISIASFPWALLAFAGLSRSRRPLLRCAYGGLALATTSLQPQLWVATAAICVLLCILLPLTRRVRAAAFAALIVPGTLLILPSVAGSAWAHSASQLAERQTITFYERNNSAPVVDAPLGLGYFAHYAEDAYATWGRLQGVRFALWIVPLGAIVTAIAVRSRTVVAFSASWALLLVLVMGLYGPGSPLIGWAFDRYLWTSAFRELYHFAWPMWILATVLGGVSLQRLPGVAKIVACFALCAAIAALWLPRNYGGTLRSYPALPQVRDAQTLVAGLPGNDRYALFPAIAPIGPASVPQDAGVDRDGNPIGAHPVANVQEMPDRLAAALMVGESGGNGAASWLDAFGIGSVVARPDYRSRRTGDAPVSIERRRFLATLVARSSRSRKAPALRRSSLAFASTAIDVVSDPFAQPFRNGFLWQPEIAPQAWPQFAAPPLSVGNWNGFDGWVLARYWYWVTPQFAFWPDGAMTFSGAPFVVPRGGAYSAALVVSSAPEIRVGARLVPVRANRATWIRLRAGERTIANAGEYAEIIGFAASVPAVSPRVPSARSWNLSYSNSCMCASGTVPPLARWIVLKETYDDGWTLQLRPATAIVRHVRFSGYGNAWEIRPQRGPLDVRIRYAPAQWWQPLTNASLLLWLVAAALAVAVDLGGRRLRARRA